MELQYSDSEGTSLMAENRIFPSIDLMIDFVTTPPRRANRSDTSTYSYVRDEGDSRIRRGTQCVEATSVGCNLKGGSSGSVQRKTNGQSTIILFGNISNDHEREWELAYGTLPQEVLTTLSGRLPRNKAWGDVRSNPISSEVSLIATALSSSSSGSLFPPGRAT